MATEELEIALGVGHCGREGVFENAGLCIEYSHSAGEMYVGARVFAQWGDSKFTYREMNDVANSMGNGFLELGLKKNDTALIFMPNYQEYINSWFGLSKIGVIEVPVNSAY